MKNILLGIGIVAAIVLLIFTYNFGKRQGDTEIKRQIDSIMAIPPDTIIVTDTIFPEPEIKWVFKEVFVPVPVPDKPGLNTYQDSLVNDELAIYVNDTVQGYLLNREIGYKLFVPKIITKTSTIFEQVPVIVQEPVSMNGVLIGSGIGGGNAFTWSVGGAYKKGRSQFGVDYLRFNNTSNWLISYKYMVFKTK